jgi:hypothetical protein
VEDFAFAERHVATGWLLVIEMSPVKKISIGKKIKTFEHHLLVLFVNFLLDVKRVSVTGRHHLVVLFPLVLDDQFDLILQTEEE